MSHDKKIKFLLWQSELITCTTGTYTSIYMLVNDNLSRDRNDE